MGIANPFSHCMTFVEQRLNGFVALPLPLPCPAAVAHTSRGIICCLLVFF
jgi:hypothetical protein